MSAPTPAGADPEDGGAASGHGSNREPHHRRWPRVALALVLLLVLLAGSLAALVTTEPGARLALRAAGSLTGGRLAPGTVSGTLLGPLTLADLRWRDPAAGLDLEVGRLQLDLRAGALLRGRLQVAALDLRRVRVRLSEPTEPREDAPLTLAPPFDMAVDALSVRDATLERDGATLLALTSVEAAASWTAAGLNVARLDLLSPQGELHFAGNVAERSGVFAGQGSGRFRWQVGERRFVGQLQARARETLADFELRLSEPVEARLDLGLGLGLDQAGDLPWHFTLDVPAFDPRERLLPDTALQRLGAQLSGRGSLRRGEARGTVQLDDQSLVLDALRLERRGEALGIDATLRNAAGRLRAAGELQLAAQPLAGRFDLDWSDVVVPASLAGQVLHSRGSARVEGSLERYAVRGRFALGPPRRLADVRLAAVGTPEGLDLEQLEISQAAGRLAARGRIDFGDALGWRLDADARDFDPGAFFAAWPGRLSFALSSSGEAHSVEDADASLKIAALRGRLRGRAVTGGADLRLSPGPALAGSLELRSGASRLSIDSKPGADLDAVARLDVPSLDDWLPGIAGTLTARLSATGEWPLLRLEGRADARGLRSGGASAEAVELRFELVRPLDPRGTLRLDARGLQVPGFDVAVLALRAEGEASAHRVELDATGQPLSVELRLGGARADDGWRGEVSRLVVDTRGVARLTLQEPVNLAWSGARFELSEACLADGDIRLCLEGRGDTDGALLARYELARLPLALAAAFAPTALPVALDGTIDGSGRVQRDADGLLQGEAQLRSAGGRISLAPVEGEAQSQRLLDYAELRVDADFAGNAVRATLDARLDGTGSVAGQLSAGGVGTARTPLDGSLRLTLPSLTVAGAFVPQLANVDGRLTVDATLGGTLDLPQVRGELRASELVADVPELGIELRDGRLRIVPQDDDRFALDGGLRSGDGELRFAGDAGTDGSVQLRLEGRDFLAADRPGARVVVAPVVTLARTDGRIDVQGKVAIPVARIDLQRLPRGGGRARAASPDVVVIDDETRLDADAAALPLYASIDVALGEAVTLVGFGLDATVTGNLQVNERPGAVTTGSGEIRVAGTYKAYGQDLTVRQGQLLFAATPLDDPRLNIVAVRVVEDVTAGLRVTGRAQAPQLEVFSTPAMGQASALAYLVTGKPIEEIGQGEGDALQSAARSLGTAAGGLLAKNVGRRLGIDELGIKESAAVGGEVLTIGQYLSPRLYLSYGVGLFTPGEVVTLRYKISESVSVEVENATESSRAGIEYRIER